MVMTQTLILALEIALVSGQIIGISPFEIHRAAHVLMERETTVGGWLQVLHI